VLENSIGVLPRMSLFALEDPEESAAHLARRGCGYSGGMMRSKTLILLLSLGYLISQRRIPWIECRKKNNLLKYLFQEGYT
jgi:hypothetical protein